MNIVPRNIISAFHELNLLGIIFTALAFGLAIRIEELGAACRVR
ncbi:hypothetical protein ACJROX_02785 [Pseudalkalibacillus sp. A8]